MHSIFSMVPVDPNVLIDRQRRAEDFLLDAENHNGVYSNPDSYESYEDYERARQETIAQQKDILKPLNLAGVTMPQLPLVRLDPTAPENQSAMLAASDLRLGSTYLLLGEISQMSGLVVVAEYGSGKVFAGYNAERFEVVPANEA